MLLKDGSYVQFNGARVSLNRGKHKISQLDHISILKCISEQNNLKYDFLFERGRGAYIAALRRPDPTFGHAQASQILSPDLTHQRFKCTHQTSQRNSAKKPAFCVS